MLTYLEILRAMSGAGADYAWIGVSAAGVYGSTLSSMDFDFFIRPEAAHLDKARNAFRELGMVGLHPKVSSNNLILMEVTEMFTDPGGGPSVDLLTKISGPSFETVWRRHEVHTFQGVSVCVASLRHIIESKQAAGRAKDIYTIKRLADDLGLEVKEAAAQYKTRKKSRRK